MYGRQTRHPDKSLPLRRKHSPVSWSQIVYEQVRSVVSRFNLIALGRLYRHLVHKPLHRLRFSLQLDVKPIIKCRSTITCCYYFLLILLTRQIMTKESIPHMVINDQCINSRSWQTAITTAITLYYERKKIVLPRTSNELHIF